MRKTLLLLLCLTIVPFAAAADGIAIDAIEKTVHPYETVTVAFQTPSAGRADILLLNAAGERVSVIAERFDAWAGHNEIRWDGTWQGVPAPEGDYFLTVRQGEDKASVPVTVGAPLPFLYNVISSGTVSPEKRLVIEFTASRDTTVVLSLAHGADRTVLGSGEVAMGQQQIVWDGSLDSGMVRDGEITLALRLEDETGLSSKEEMITVRAEGFGAASAMQDPADEYEIQENYTEPDVPSEERGAGGSAREAQAEDQKKFTPSYGSPYEARPEEAGTYWTTPMDITDEEAVWKALMAPVTVLDTGKKRAQMSQIVIREEPDEKARGVGVVTCVSQGVRVLEKGSEWTKIECYSSSFHDSKVKAWNMLVQGWVPTKYLKTVTPDPGMGIVVDKLTQRLYIFVDGHLYDTLLCSTGHANEKQPYNESRSGEFLMLVPAVGGYEDEGMYVRMAIRYNGGDMVHQVPYTLAKDGSKYFGTFEPRLGTKASHGCIRVQRRKTPLGTSMQWIWDRKKNNTKFLIWEDWQGRQLSYPSDDTPVYRNPKGGKQYHSSATCNAAKNVTFEPFTYGELEDSAYAGLTRCTYCNPPLRKGEIDEINALYAPGGDHDPVLTRAIQKYLDSIK